MLPIFLHFYSMRYFLHSFSNSDLLPKMLIMLAIHASFGMTFMLLLSGIRFLKEDESMTKKNPKRALLVRASPATLLKLLLSTIRCVFYQPKLVLECHFQNPEQQIWFTHWRGNLPTLSSVLDTVSPKHALKA